MINPFVPNAPFLYRLKTSENRKVFCFQGVEKGCIGTNGLKGAQVDLQKAFKHKRQSWSK